jgi:predicted NBD/HSP70 family sugar kinase
MTARVLQMIRRAKSPLSKAELADESGFSLSAVSDHVERLIVEQLIEVNTIGNSSGGRKPKQYSLNSRYGHILSIELGTTSVQIAITNFNCEILCSKASSIDINEGPDKVLTYIQQLAEQLMLEFGLDKASIKGIGIGVPGPVDFSLGIPITPPLMQGWDNYLVPAFWSKYYDCPCFVDNDVNIMALGEHAKGYKFEIDNLIYIKIGSGIGSGVIYDGKLYRGSAGSAGDIGHFDIGNDVLCWCGNRGCLEASAGGKAIVSKGKVLASSMKSDFLSKRLQEHGDITLEDIRAGVLNLDPVSVEIIRESGALLGRVLASIVNFSNPDLVAIGSEFSEYEDILLASIRQSVYQRSLPLATRKLLINKSILGNTAGLIGGAFMTIDQLIIQATNDKVDSFLK